MFRVDLSSPDDFEGWRGAARALAGARVPTGAVQWQTDETPTDLFAEAQPLPPPGAPFAVPRSFVNLAESVVLHRDPARFTLLYAVLLRIRDGGPGIEDHADPVVRRLEVMAKQVRRDIHKMRAFLRFREVADADGGERFVAWFEPEHHIVRANAGFFVRRFAAMRWSILTPDLSIHWDGETATEGPGGTRADAPGGDPIEEVWKTYYASIFNPARLKVGMMLKEMPRRYWHNMPETALVSELIAGARARESGMIATARTALGGNSAKSWAALREEALGCTRCPLFKDATQTVFGEGPLDAAMMLIGEQPGDQEDLAGRAFVGPAGQRLDQALGEAGIDRASLYLSNAVKHFKFERRGKRRIHQSPRAGEIDACRWWIDQERTLVAPRMTVLLGATAVRSVLGAKAGTIASLRGRPIPLAEGGEAWVTVHPSFLLRVREDAEGEHERFVADLRGAWARLAA
ncbi:DNA polymerase [Sphingomonas zeicaulis]|uniref:UdgX family uracil-DNA binding protein n=1 Tax=Sphingomonas zeicaulis TaxID=1632740 RepID=UPI003D19316F